MANIIFAMRHIDLIVYIVYVGGEELILILYSNLFVPFNEMKFEV